jgi:endothelin-converting enzyme/putative endopeptidase
MSIQPASSHSAEGASNEYNVRVRPPTLTALLFVVFPAAGLAQNTKPVSGVDLDALDKSADPCVDFYQYACGNWMATHPIPPSESRWGRSNELADRNREILRGILEKASVDDARRTPVEQKIGDFYYACMDERTVNAKEYDPLKPELARVDALTDKSAIEAQAIRLQRDGVGVFFAFRSEPDPKNSTMTIADADQGGLGLPDRDYYLKDDENSVKLRAAYVEHVTHMFQLIGEPPQTAGGHAHAVMALETELAKASLDRVARRDPRTRYHKMTVAELAALCPFVEWTQFIDGVGAPKIETLNVDVPDFFRALDKMLTAASLDTLKAYLKWHLLHAAAASLSQPFVDEDFAFYEKTLRGTKELRPRWKRCVDTVDRQLGEALGQKYVEETFGAEGKQHTLKMVRAIEKEMSDDLHTLAWMTPETKKQAFVKLEAIANKIGYPDTWRDYSSVRIVRDDFRGDTLRAAAFEVQRQLHKIGNPVDRMEWHMTPPTVNAYYSQQENNINFPAGILQPPFYSNGRDEAVNYGGIGVVVGHELTHGFDDQGRKYDAQGNLRDWWTKEDAVEFKKRAQCLIDEYSKFETVPGVHLNGKLTLGENTADNGGLRLAFMALMDSLEGKEAALIDGFTPEQRLFLGFGQVWCQNQTPETARLLAQTDPHSSGRYRTNGTVQNMTEFQKAFACKLGQPMVAAPACRVW